MNQQSNKNGYTGAKVMALLIKKAKLIICISLIAAVLASAAAIALGFSCMTYGNTVSLYISKEDASNKVMPFLTSEVFAERLLLDEYGLPAELAKNPKYKDQYEEAKNAVIAYNEARAEWRAISLELSRVSVSLTTPKDPVTGQTLTSLDAIEERYSRLKATYTSLYELLAVYMSASAEGMVTEDQLVQISAVQAQLVKAQAERDAFRDSAYVPAILELQELQTQYGVCTNVVRDARKVADEHREALLEEWRKDGAVKEKVSAITGALTFSYEIPGDEDSILQKETTNVTLPEEPEKMYSFLKVYVSVEGDEELAAFIVDRLKVVLPEYVKESVERFNNFDTVDCIVTSPSSEAAPLDVTSVITSTALAAIVAFVLVAALICFIIVGVDYTRSIKAQNAQIADENKSAK